jgi:AhpD family alkylhydroperoxidase
MIQHGVLDLNYAYTKRAVLHVGIGVHTGPVFMGVLGEEGRKDYTAIGDHVNTASRLCSQAKGGEVLFTKPFKEALPTFGGIAFRETMTVKGKKEPLDVYCYTLDLGYPDIQQNEDGSERPMEPASGTTNRVPSYAPHVTGETYQAADELTRKDKELIAVAASIASGCQQCSDYHFVKVFDEGATVGEVEKAVHEALDAIRYASGVMQHKAYVLMEIPHKATHNEEMSTNIDRLSLLLKIGAVVALNNITGIENAIGVAVRYGVRLEDIQMTVALSKIVAAKAREFADDAIQKALDRDVPKRQTSLAACDLGRLE